MKNKTRASLSVPKPIPPRSVVRLAACPSKGHAWKKNVGAIYRIGYYSRRDGLDCIWLVNETGEYQETVDHDYLSKYFDVIQVSDEKSLYGAKRPQIAPVIATSKGHRSRIRTSRRS
jgi:hypothetical protein